MNKRLQELYNVRTQLKAVKNFDVSELLTKLDQLITENGGIKFK